MPIEIPIFKAKRRKAVRWGKNKEEGAREMRRMGIKSHTPQQARRHWKGTAGAIEELVSRVTGHGSRGQGRFRDRQ